MKKLFFCLLGMLMMVGCSIKKEETATTTDSTVLGCSIGSDCLTSTEEEIKNYETQLATDTFVSLTLEEALQQIETSKTADVYYFGFKTCPWCQDIIDTLKEVADENGQKVYYVNVRPEGDTSEYDLRVDTNVAYIQLVEIFKETLTDDTGKIYVPFVVAVKEQKVLAYHYSTVDGHDSKEREMTAEETAQLKTIYEDLFATVK